MILTSLIEKLNGFAPPKTPQNGARRPGEDSDPAASPRDRFGPATRVGLSSAALTWLAQPEEDRVGSTPYHDTRLEPASPILLPGDGRPSVSELSRIHRIAAAYHDDPAPEARDRMLAELREAGLHPEQLRQAAVPQAEGHGHVA